MSITDMIDDAKKTLDGLIRKHKFRKANLQRQEKAELTAEISRCNGKLAECKASYKSAIKEQYVNIAEGTAKGYDTIPQEQILWDAALGYMLVEDAMFALRSIGSYDSMVRAYSMLDATTKTITGKKGGLFGKLKPGGNKERDVFGYINSEEVRKEKEEILSGFFEQLKLTGDIDACLKNAKRPGSIEADHRSVYTGSSSTGAPSAKMGTSSLDAYFNSNGGQDDGDYSDIPDSTFIDGLPPKI